MIGLLAESLAATLKKHLDGATSSRTQEEVCGTSPAYFVKRTGASLV